MIPVIFDPEAKSEFLEAVRYYEEVEVGSRNIVKCLVDYGIFQ